MPQCLPQHACIHAPLWEQEKKTGIILRIPVPYTAYPIQMLFTTVTLEGGQTCAPEIKGFASQVWLELEYFLEKTTHQHHCLNQR